MEEQGMKTSLEDLRNQALAEYELAASAIHSWSSFIVNAIKNYDPDSSQLEPPVIKPTEMIVNLDIYRTKVSKEGRMLVISSDGDLIIKVKAENRIWIQAE